MTGIEILIGCFAPEALIPALVAGIIGNRSDGAVQACGRLIYRGITQDPNNPTNHDVLLAVQSAYVRSLQLFSKNCLERFSRAGGSVEERLAADAIQKVVAQLHPRRPLPAWTPDSATLDADAEAMFAPGGGLANGVAARTCAALIAATGPLPATIEAFFHQGAAPFRSWLANFQLLFAEQVKTNPRVSAITTYAGIAELKAQGFDLAARMTELIGEARAQADALMAIRDQVIAFWEDVGTTLAGMEAQNERRHSEVLAALARQAEMMARLEREDRQIELRITNNPADEQLLRGHLQALRAQQPDADLATILTSFASAITERDSLRAELEALRAEDNRIAGLVQAAEAAIEAGELPQARSLIDDTMAVHAEREAESRRQRARLLSVRARTFILQLDYRSALAGLDQAAAVTPDEDQQFDYFWDAAGLAAEWAGKLPDPEAPQEAARRWHDLLGLVDKSVAPEQWAGVQTNLGNALRTLGERQNDPAALYDAIAAYRAALTVSTREALPLDWAQIQINLGIAIRILGERQDDPAALYDAIAAYRAALTVCTREALPLDWAITQNNLGNALRALSERQDDPTALNDAIAAYRAALTVRTREALPLDWAQTQNNLGNALVSLGLRQDDPAALIDAIAAYRTALTVHTREALPLDWAGVQNNLGNALRTLGERQDDPAALIDAIAAYRGALTVRTREALPLDWAITQNGLGNALRALSERQDDPTALNDAIAALRAALTVRTREALPLDWAQTQNGLGVALGTLSGRRDDPAALNDAIAALRAALTVYTRDTLPLDWAMTQNNLGNALKAVGEQKDDPAALNDAIAAYRAALTVYTRQALPLDWAMTHNNLGIAHAILSERLQQPELMRAAILAFEAALTVYSAPGLDYFRSMAERNLASARTLLAGMGG